MGRLRLRPHPVACLLGALPVMAKDLQSRVDEGTATPSLPSTAQSYFREPTSSSILYGHVGLMLLSWIGCFPICRYFASNSFHHL